MNLTTHQGVTQQPSHRLLKLAILWLCLFAAGYLGSSFGQVLWDRGANSGLWDKPNNWDPNGVPASGANLLFDNTFVSSAQSINLKGNRTVGTMSFNAPFSYSFVGAATEVLTLGNTFTQSGSGEVTINPEVALGGNRLFQIDGSGVVTISGIVSGAGNSLTKAGAGTLTLSGANTYSGGTIINQGTLLLGSADRLADSGNIQLSGGKLNTGGFNETVGMLTLTANSFIDLNSGASILSFADSSMASWTAGTILQIDNWSGSPTGGGTDQVFFGSSDSALTQAQLNQIRLLDPFGSGSGLWEVKLLPTGEIVPIPEASTVWVLVMIGGLVGYRERRQLMLTIGCVLKPAVAHGRKMAVPPARHELN